MKYPLITLLFLFSLSAQAQKPQPVYSFARVQMPLHWYIQQASLWKKEVDKNPKNAPAWYYYYRVTRNLNRCDTTDKRTPQQKDKDIKQLVERMGKSVPNSYEYNLCKWMTGGNDFANLPYLKKAMELGEGHWEYLEDVALWGEVERDLAKRDLYCKKWMATGEVSGGMLNYNYNVLQGLPPNAILFTSGDNDTFPVWVLQALDFRKDVTVLNTSLLLLDDYREKIFRELGANKWDLVMNDSKSMARFEREIIRHVAANTTNRPVCVSLTTSGCGDFVKDIESSLYLTGLAYEYHPEPMDNLALLKKNFEQKYALDYLETTFYNDISANMVAEINRNYLVPMIKLFQHYKTAGEANRMEWIKSKLMAVSKGTAEQAEIEKLLAEK